MIKDLINDIAFDKITLSQALTRAKIIAYKIENSAFQDWIKRELQGYNHSELLPEYRVIGCIPYITVDYGYGKRGTVPMDIRLDDQELTDEINTIKQYEAIGSIETLIKNVAGASVKLLFAPNQLLAFQNLLAAQLGRGQIIQGYKECNKAHLINIIDQTKYSLLETLMELNKQFPDLENEFNPTKENTEKVQNIITNNIYGNNNPTNIAAGNEVSQSEITNTVTVDEKKLSDLGVEEKFVSELKQIIVDTKEKSTIGGKVLKWMGAVSVSLISKGLADKIPFSH